MSDWLVFRFLYWMYFLISRWCQAVGSVYSGLQALSERSSMVSRALEYIGDIMKHIKPSLVSKNQDGLQMVYWAVGEETHRRDEPAGLSVFVCLFVFASSQTKCRSRLILVSRPLFKGLASYWTPGHFCLVLSPSQTGRTQKFWSRPVTNQIIL